MTMKLYGALASPYVARVALAARAKGLDIPIEMPAGGIKSPEYLAINPLGKMPTLEHDGRHLIESQVILEYLEDVVPQPALLPMDAFEAARARLLSRLLDLYVAPEAGALLRNMNPANRDPAAVETAKGKLVAGFGHLEHFMSAGPYAVGQSLTHADCALLPHFVMLKQTVFPGMGVTDPTTTLPRLKAWWAQMEKDPVTGRFAADYGAAFSEFIKRMMGGNR
jgi:glutathione S-transferase